MATPTNDDVTIDVSAPPERVYGLISDITRMGEWSPECRRCEWIDGATGPAVGARFRGHNRLGPVRWSTTSKVVAADPGREFAFTVVLGDRDETRWRYRLEPTGSGTSITESYEFVWAPLRIRLGNRFMPRPRLLNQGMRKTLARIKTAAEAQAGPPPPSG